MRHLLYPAPLTHDLLGFQWDAIEEEILLRTQLLMSTYNTGVTSYGIVDAADPASAYTGGSRPFSVSVTSPGAYTIDINGGTAVFKSGEVIVIADGVLTTIDVASYVVNARNIVYLEFGEEDKDIVITRFLTPTYSKVDYYTDPKDYIKVLLEADYNALSTAEKDLTIPLALVTSQIITAAPTQLVVDMSKTDLTINRPWFSVSDNQHRSLVGTGRVTITNPHGESFNDISVTDEQTFFQVLLDHGMIVAKDQGLAGVPGVLCSDVISASAGSIIEDSATGEATGINGAYYFSLSKFPRSVVRCTDNDTKQKDYAPAHLPGKNIVFLIPNDEYDPLDIIAASLTSIVGTVYDATSDGATLSIIVDDNTLFSVTFSGIAVGGLAAIITQINNAAQIAISPTAVIASNSGGLLKITSLGLPTSLYRSQIAVAGSAVTPLGFSLYPSKVCAVNGTYAGSELEGETLLLHIDSYAISTTFNGLDGIDNVVQQINTAAVAAGVAVAPPVACNNNGQLQLASQITGVGSFIRLVSWTGTDLTALGLATIPIDTIINAGDVGNSGDLNVVYSAIDACQPPVSLISTTFPIEAPGSLETVIAGGVVLTSFSTTDLTFESAGHIPCEYRVYIDSTGAAKRYPQTVFCVEKLSTLGFASIDVTIPMVGRGKLRVGLIEGGLSPSVSIQLTGTDINGAALSEILTFGSTYIDSTIPYIPAGPPPYLTYENAAQWMTTQNIFYTLDSILVLTSAGVPVTAAITVQALVDPITTPELADILPVAFITWDGLKISNTWDIRPISTLLKPTASTLTIASGGKALAETTALLWDRQTNPNLNYVLNFWHEDFEHPECVSTEVTDTTYNSGLIPTETLVQKVSEGLGPDDVYVSKPVAICPNQSLPRALRFIPIEPGITFHVSARYYFYVDSTHFGWSPWRTLTYMSVATMPLYTINFAAEAVALGTALDTTPGCIVKWQMYVTGEVKGMAVVYITDVPSFTGSFVWDSGAWGDSTF